MKHNTEVNLKGKPRPTPKDLTGITVGMLTVMYPIEKPKWSKSKNRGQWWLCKCECGNEKEVVSSELKSKHGTKSCGCLRHKGPFKGYGEIPKSVYTGIKNWNAKSRGLNFDVSIEYLWELFLKQDRKCAYSGLELKFGKSKNDPSKTASLDRIDSNKGYIKGNVIWCHKKINTIKMNQTLEDFRKYCKLITDYEKASKAVISSCT